MQEIKLSLGGYKKSTCKLEPCVFCRIAQYSTKLQKLGLVLHVWEKKQEKELRDWGDAALHVLADITALLAELALIGNIRIYLEPLWTSHQKNNNLAWVDQSN